MARYVRLNYLVVIRAERTLLVFFRNKKEIVEMRLLFSTNNAHENILYSDWQRENQSAEER